MKRHYNAFTFPGQENYNLKVYKHLRNCSSWEQIDKNVIYTGFGTESERAKTERWYQIEYKSVTDGLNHQWATRDMTASQYQQWYYKNNAGAKRLYKTRYYKDNAETIKQKRKQYREINKEEIARKKAIKGPCDLCGAVVRIDYMAKHKMTQKCLNNRVSQ